MLAMDTPVFYNTTRNHPRLQVSISWKHAYKKVQKTKKKPNQNTIFNRNIDILKMQIEI